MPHVQNEVSGVSLEDSEINAARSLKICVETAEKIIESPVSNKEDDRNL